MKDRNRNTVKPGDILMDDTGAYMLEEIYGSTAYLCELEYQDDDYVLTDSKRYLTAIEIRHMEKI